MITADRVLVKHILRSEDKVLGASPIFCAFKF
jgi:hypothetical protein